MRKPALHWRPRLRLFRPVFQGNQDTQAKERTRTSLNQVALRCSFAATRLHLSPRSPASHAVMSARSAGVTRADLRAAVAAD